MADALQGEQAKSRFLAIVSHEMRTPLNGLLAGVELMKTTELSERQKWLANVIHDSGKAALRQVDNVLELTRLDEIDSTLYAPAPFVPTKLVSSIVDEFKTSADLHGNEIRFVKTGDTDQAVMASELHLQRLVQNFLSNANKFTEDGIVEIFLDMQTVGSVVDITLVVSDTGIGIEKEDLDRIFLDFESVDGAFTRSKEGAGLGLGICRRAAKALGGEIRVESEPDKGSTFTVVFSLPSTSLQQSDDGSKNAELEGKSFDVLVVEDNKVNRDILAEILELEGHNVAEAENGKEAVDICNDIRFDIILMDISMPVMDGVEATRLIRTEGRFPDVPIIGVTAHAVPAKISEFEAAGMNEVVLKPISTSSITQVLIKFADGKGALSEEFTLQGSSQSPDSLDPKHVDRDTYNTLLEMLGADAVRGYVQQFMNDFDSSLPIVKQLIAEMRGEDAASEAHKIAGSAAVLGASGARALLVRFEDVARAEDYDECALLLSEIDQLKAEIGDVLMPD